MSVCDDMREVMECARMEDECDYSVYSQMFDLIGDVEAENAKLRELLLDCWDFSHLMHGAMAARFYELGLIDDGEARELGIEVGCE